jgi:hypothetical protein
MLRIELCVLQFFACFLRAIETSGNIFYWVIKSTADPLKKANMKEGR